MPTLAVGMFALGAMPTVAVGMLAVSLRSPGRHGTCHPGFDGPLLAEDLGNREARTRQDVAPGEFVVCD